MAISWTREDLVSRLCVGTFLNLASPVTAEMAAGVGFDWLLIDMEHGPGDYAALVSQLQAIGSSAVPIVRIAANDPVTMKRVLDAGAGGIMVPYVSTVADAKNVVRGMRYPPDGIRGVAATTRATDFGADFDDYFSRANTHLLTVVQIETREAVENAAAIAQVDGVDVLFVGPLDLSVNLGCPKQFNDPKFRASLASVVQACQQHGKAAGILTNLERAKRDLDDGFKFVAIGSDGLAVASGLRSFFHEITRDQ